MTTAVLHSSSAIEESTHEFADAFMLHVSTAIGFGENRVARIAHVKVVLMTAIASRDGASSAWRAFYATVEDLLKTASVARYTLASREYLQAFLEENRDLAGDVP